MGTVTANDLVYGRYTYNGGPLMLVCSDCDRLLTLAYEALEACNKLAYDLSVRFGTPR